MPGLINKEPAPVSVKAGQYEFLKLHASGYDLRDLYHWMLTLTWRRFSAFIFGVYLALNLFFAALYYARQDCIGEMPPGSFGGAFFFSVETLATVGYGHMYPATWYGHVVTTVEIMTGMFGLAVMTGLIFVRFSRPNARVLFSSTAVVGPFNGTPAFMVRVGNMRHQALVEVEFRLMMTCNELTAEGEIFRRFYPLTLQFDRLIMFPAAVTVRHMIDETSPLHGWAPEQWEKQDVRFPGVGGGGGHSDPGVRAEPDALLLGERAIWAQIRRDLHRSWRSADGSRLRTAARDGDLRAGGGVRTARGRPPLNPCPRRPTLAPR